MINDDGASSEKLRTPVQFLKGVGPRRADDFATIGVITVEDLLLSLPRRYEDRRLFQEISSLRQGETASVVGEVLSCGLRNTRRPGFRLFEMLVEDRSGRIRVTFLNQSYLRDVFKPHQHVVVYGKADRRRTGGLQITNPDYEILSTAMEDRGTLIHTGRIIPVYERTGSLTSKVRRRVVHKALQLIDENIDDPLPLNMRQAFECPSRAEAFIQVHFPEDRTSLENLNSFRTKAQKRLILEEFFLFQVGLCIRRRELDRRIKPRVVKIDDRIRRAALNILPFRLTGHQRQALKEIVEDLQGSRPMNRLLQGDVGSGKTIVALLASLVVMENGLQVAMMSPTELLAEQHYATVVTTLKTSRFSSVLLTAGQSAKAREEAVKDINAGKIQLVVGTHALVQDNLKFDSLGLVVIDEQHRFGVNQRAALRAKGFEPDVLLMTATPIPRTLALSVYGDLDVSDIRERPPGRKVVTTIVRSESYRKEIYDLVRVQLQHGRQAFVVCPLIEESPNRDIKAATEMAMDFDSRVFSEYRVGLVHGRLKTTEREQIMKAFATGEIQILVATTVVEVGIDVPNAVVMLVEQAERFGLAQLHQLRGRVGRGMERSYCAYIHAQEMTEAAKARLKVIADTTDGFEIAERDLELRGPGDFFGTRQSGVPEFRVGELIRDYRLMEAARHWAISWFESEQISEKELSAFDKWWTGRYGLLAIG